MRFDFDKIFHPETRWGNKRLTDNCPCSKCEVFKDYEQIALYGTIGERQYATLPESCRSCPQKLSWQNDCMQKLRWYEDHDERLRGDT